MRAIFAAEALLSGGWAGGVRILVDRGSIAAIEAAAVAEPGDERHDILLPGMPNLHSHAFQRGMAGLAERRGPADDNFWSWREAMYRFALTMSPDEVEAVAAQLYAEMLESGFCRVGEFHYLHHDVDGRPYGDAAEMAARIAAAAGRTGIGLTLLPVFYAHSGFGGAPPADGQKRFVNDIEGFAGLLESSRKLVRSLPGARLGVAPHSLRAVTPDELAAIAALMPEGPIHIHAAEQTREVEDCVAWSGARPVEWLLDNAGVDGRWCLIHATHMSAAETAALAASGAVAGLCPVTEANLGDGTFPAPDFLEHGGRFGIGSDSNVEIGVPAELRQLEYAQRLLHRRRNILAEPGQSNGRALYERALGGGSAALGEESGGLGAGASADFFTLDAGLPSLAGKTGDSILDAWIFALGGRVDCAWVAGRKLVEGGRHVDGEAIADRFRKVMADIAAR